MDEMSLAACVADQLAAFFSGVAQGVGESAGNELYAVVARRMRASSDRAAFTSFEDDPASAPARSGFVNSLAQQFVDDAAFKQSVTALVDRSVMATTRLHFEAPRVQASGGSQAAGNDINQNTNYGGIVVGAVAVAVVLIVVFFVGKAIVVNIADAASGSLDGSSTCEEYLASTDSAEKARVMKDLYLEKGRAELAADPFIIQNTEYFCGTRPDLKLQDLVSARA